MNNKKFVSGILIGVLVFTPLRADTHTVSMFFEVNESALNTLFQTQVFPHPVGVHAGENYEITLWAPQISIEPGQVVFSFTITGYVGDIIQYDFPLSLPLNIPSGELSVSGIIAFLEGIPAQINNLDGPQWLKDIIIAEYEGLEVYLYPNSLFMEANESIPGFIDVEVMDIAFTWSANDGLLTFELSILVDSNAPWIIGQWMPVNSGFRFRFYSNVETEVLYLNVYNVLGGNHTNDSPDLTLTPDVWSGFTGVSTNGGFGQGNYHCKVLFGSGFGWFGVQYVFNYVGQDQNVWHAMAVSGQPL